MKFTTDSRKPAASTFKIEEYSEEGGSMFFETYVSLYRATVHRITDDSKLQEKTCVRKISFISTRTLQIVTHRSGIHLAYTKCLSYASSLYKL